MKKDLQNILKQEENFWAQKSRVQWLAHGDRNTRFFHLFTIIRRKKIRIIKLKVGGEWIDDKETPVNHINNYFNNLFNKDDNDAITDITFPTALSSLIEKI